MTSHAPLSPSRSKFDWDRNPAPHAPPATTIAPPEYHQNGAGHRPGHSRGLASRSQSDWTNSYTLASPTRGPRNWGDRLSKYLFDLRMPTEPTLPIQQPPLKPWPPLDVEKRHVCEECAARSDRHRRRKILFVVLVLFLLLFLGNIIFLDVRIARLSSSTTIVAAPSTTSAAASATSSATMLSSDAQQCLSQYTLNAPSDPQSYPCSTCLPALQDVPPAFAQTDQSDGQQIQDAIQFCGLRSIFESANSDGQQGLSNAGWVKDVRFCAWQGVQCDGFGRVSTIQLSFPEVPATIPADITALTSLTSLQLIGDTNVPAGDFPSSFTSLSALTTLHLESTAMNSPSSTLLSSLGNLTTLTLVKNANMTDDMTSGFASLPLVNLVINDQTLPTNPVSTLLSSAAGKTLQTLDLSSTALTGSLPSDLSGFAAMVELHLDNNALTNPLPSTFPANLQSLTLTDDQQLVGAIEAGTSFCALTHLQTCNVQGSGLSVSGGTGTGGCGVCEFS